MESKKPIKARVSISNHLIIYFALYFAGAFGGFWVGWMIAVILQELKITWSALGAFIAIALFIIGAYFPRLLFARKVPAICPSCGGTAFLKWPSKPISYVCSECGHIHKTILRLGRILP